MATAVEVIKDIIKANDNLKLAQGASPDLQKVLADQYNDSIDKAEKYLSGVAERAEKSKQPKTK